MVSKESRSWLISSWRLNMGRAVSKFPLATSFAVSERMPNGLVARRMLWRVKKKMMMAPRAMKNRMTMARTLPQRNTML